MPGHRFRPRQGEGAELYKYMNYIRAHLDDVKRDPKAHARLLGAYLSREASRKLATRGMQSVYRKRMLIRQGHAHVDKHRVPARGNRRTTLQQIRIALEKMRETLDPALLRKLERGKGLSRLINRLPK